MGDRGRCLAADARAEAAVRSARRLESGPVRGGDLMAGAFDLHHPPAPELISQCVHCGFCLTACPTYVLWRNEMDSPRGRIYLMKMAGEGGGCGRGRSCSCWVGLWGRLVRWRCGGVRWVAGRRGGGAGGGVR